MEFGSWSKRILLLFFLHIGLIPLGKKLFSFYLQRKKTLGEKLYLGDIPFISKDRKERIIAIATYLKSSKHNIVCLQEIWSESDYLFLKEDLKGNFPYSHYFYSGVQGSGLCVFSKWLIQDVFFHQWPLNGYIHKIHHGDWFGGKGVGLCRIRHDDELINVYCTHLHAEYHVDDMYLAHRVLQAYSTAEFVNLTSTAADVCILAGDLNTAPGDLSYKLITEVPALLDPFDLKCEAANPETNRLSGTSDVANNSYSNPKLVKVAPEGKRIDHILFHVSKSWEASVKSFGNPLEDRVPDQKFSYSDHNAVALELHIEAVPNCSNFNTKANNSHDDSVIKEAIKVCEEAIATLSKSKRLFITLGSLLLMFLLGFVDFWPNNILYDIVKIVITGLSLYYFIMGTLWNKIEVNSLKALLISLTIYKQSRIKSDNSC